MTNPRFSLLVLGGLLLAPVVEASTSPLWSNTGLYSYTTPPDVPPQIDATAFVNYGQMYFTDLNYEYDTFGYFIESYPRPFEPWNTLYYTNFNLMQGSPGWQFDYYDSDSARHRAAANFVNQGLVNDTNASIYGDATLLIQATNILNRGTLAIGDGGLLQLTGDNLDLTRSTIASVGADTDPMAYLQELYWSSTNITGFFEPGGYTTYLYISQPISTNVNFDVNIVFLSQTNAAISTEVRFFGEDFFGAERAVHWQSSVTNVVTGEVLTNDVYLYDDLGYYSGLRPTPPGPPGYPPLVPSYRNDLQSQFAAVTFHPENYQITRTFPFFQFGVPVAPSTLNPFIFDGTNNPVSVTNTTYGVNLTPGPFFPDPSIANSDYTNVSGRIELRAGKVLDLTRVRIDGESFLYLEATNHFAGSTNARIISPVSSFNLATTNGTLAVANLTTPTIPRICGEIDIWSGHWTNGSLANGIINYNVTIIDSRLAPQVPSLIEDLTLHCTNLVVSDVLSIFHSFSLPDTQRLTVTTNPPGSATVTGEIDLTADNVNWAASCPQLQFLTNYGTIAVAAPSSVFFGGASSQPGYNTPFVTNYQSFVNHGLVASQGQSIWARYFEDNGTNDAGVGPLTLRADTAILTNGAFFATNADLAITSGYLLASNEVITAGRSISLDTPNVTDGVPNIINLDPTNVLTAAVTNGNVWQTGFGFNLLSPPAFGDLLGTTVTNTAALNMVVPNYWAAQDLGCSPSGFLNNAAVGRLVLAGTTNSVFSFTGTGASNALYVDCLILSGWTATDADLLGNWTGIAISPNMKIYYAQALANGVSIAEKLNGQNNGRFCWVSNYNWGYFSSTNVLYPDGSTNRLNAALVTSCDLVSNATNSPPMLNCQNPVPIWPISPPPAPADNVPLLAAITVSPQGQAVLQGSNVTLSVVAASPAYLSYQWRKNGVNITDGGNISGAYSPSLTINNVQAGDAGVYSAVVSDYAGYVISGDAPLTVHVAPAISAQPQTLIVSQGATAAFSVGAQGDPPLTYQWLFNGANIPGATTSAYSRANVQPTNAGNYSVLVANPYAAVASGLAVLRVLPVTPAPVYPALQAPQVTSSTSKPSSNAFVNAVGAYSGIFSDANGVSATSSGYLSAQVTRGGAYSAKLMLGGQTYSFAGAFSVAASAATNAIGRGRGVSPLALTLHLDLSAGGQLLGCVSTTNWSAPLRAYRSVRPPAPANYTLLIPPAAGSGLSPAGDGFGTVTITAAGTVQFSGALADGAKITQTTTLSQAGYWPLFASLYGGPGCLVSWLTNAGSSGLEGQLLWLSSAGADTKYYPAGFTNEVTATASPYVAANAFAGLSQSLLIFSGGGLSVPLTNSFSFDAHHHVLAPAGSQLKLGFTATSGLFNGSTWVPQLKQTVTFQGVLYEAATDGFGYFLGSKLSGQVFLGPAPQ